LRKLVKYILLLVFVALSSSVLAQTDLKNEAELIKKAEQHFKREEFVQAFSMYQTLLSNHKDDPEYNFRYAVCLMYADRSDKSKPIFYLEKAEKSPNVDHRLYYFLGKAYQINYQFTDAITAFEKFKLKAKSSELTKYNIDRRIEECNNGIGLLSSVRGVYVINKVEVKESSFYRSYEMEKAGGKVIILPDELKTKYDKKHNAPTTCFFVSETGLIYFSSYGEKNKNGLDIWRTHRNPDGTWSQPENMGNVINTSYDEAYPYISPNGRTI